MTVIRQLNRLAQESVLHDRTPIAQIAILVNPRSTKYVRDESKLYTLLDHQQMHLVYPRIGAPHDRIMIDDLPKARDYDLYIVPDCLYLTDYCSLPVLPPAVIRNMAREAGVHIYCDNNDFMAANNWLLCVCAASDGPRTVRLPRKAKVVDALTDEVTASDATEFTLEMRYGETRVWKLEP